MPISYIFNGDPLTGTANDDFIIAFQGSTGTNTNTVNAGDGDDWVMGDSSNVYIPNAATLNGSIATAFNLESAPDTWTTDENPLFGDASVPHTTVLAEATIGEAEYYAVSVGAGQTITIDLDFAAGSAIGTSRDMIVELLDAGGTVIASSDDSLTTDGGLGSFPAFPGIDFTYDSFLNFTVGGAGTYYVRVRPFGASTFDQNNTFVLNVSVTGHATGAASVMGADIINGGAGDDALFGQGGADTINGEAGNDLIHGGSGVDNISGGDGNDTLYGGDNTEETVHGDGGNDTLYSGGEGHYYGDAGDDTIYAGITGFPNEVLDGGTGVDTLDTTTWNSTYVVNLATGTTNFGESFTNFENITTGDGADTITGTSAANIIITQGGVDIVNAGGGNDIIEGGAGADSLTGGAGNDTFQGTAAELNGDTITDFRIGDRIVLNDVALAGFSYSLSGSTLTYTGGSLTLSGAPTGQLVARVAAEGGVELTLATPTYRAGDFNGDGRDDILWRQDGGLMTDWLALANGGFTGNSANFLNSVTLDWNVAAAGDFNGDGRDDILWRNDDGRMTNWLGTATGGFTDNAANSYNSVAVDWNVTGVGDFNGDGRDDVLWRNDDGRITNWLGTANGSLASNAANSLNSVAVDWNVAGIGDFNGDGRDDILWRNNDGRMTDWLGTASGGFADNAVNAYNNVSKDWHVAGIGDFNGDGRDDILWRNDDGRLTDWLGTANGGFAPNSANFYDTLALDWHVATTGDFNGDGRDDILFRNNDGRITDWLGTANGDFINNVAHALNAVSTDWHIQPDYALI